MPGIGVQSACAGLTGPAGGLARGRRANGTWLRRGSWLALAAAWSLAQLAAAATPEEAAEAALRARYTAMKPQLEQSPFQQRLSIDSVEATKLLQGDVYAVVDYPIAAVSHALASAAPWCDVLILHLNVKYCQPVVRGGRTVLAVAIGRKIEQPVADAYRVEFAYSVAASQPEFLDVRLDARKGPLGTRNYRIGVEAVGLDAEHSFMHLRYAYNYDFQARLALQVYLRGSAGSKVGFTKIAAADGAPPAYVGGLRGVVERNSMRYYLAIDAYLASLATPAPGRFERSLQRWFDATERYARQLHEVDRDAYLAMKRREYQRQHTIQ